METIKSYIERSLKAIDMNTLPLEVRYMDNNTYSTKLSITFTVLLYSFMIPIIVFQMSSLFRREKPMSSSSTDHELTMPLNITIQNTSDINRLVLSNSNLSEAGLYYFGYGFFDYSSGDYIANLDPYFTVNMIQSNNFRPDSINLQKQRFSLTSIPCSDKINNSFFNFDATTWAKLTKLKCVKEGVITTGDFIYSDYKYLAIKVVKCTSTKGSCSSDDKLKTFLKNGVFHFMEIRLYFDNSDYNNPVKWYMNIFPYSLMPTLSLKMDHYLSREIISSYDSIVPQLSIFNTSAKIYSYITTSTIERHISKLDSNEMLDIYLRSDYSYITYKRNYIDIFRVIALICGFYQILWKVLFFMIFRLNTFILKAEVFNKIFNLVDPENMEKLQANPYLPSLKDRVIRRGSSLLLKDYRNVTDISEAVFFESNKFEMFSKINFTNTELFLLNMFIVTQKTKEKLNIFEEAQKIYSSYKDVKTLFKFVIHFRRFLKFIVTKSQNFMITKLLHKSRFHSSNLKILRMIKKRRKVKRLRIREVTVEKQSKKTAALKRSLQKYKSVKPDSLTYLDEKLLNSLSVDPLLLAIFVFNNPG